MSDKLSNDAHPLVLKNVRVQATMVNEDGDEFPVDYHLPGVCTASMSSSRQFERIFAEDGSVKGFWPGAVEAKFTFRHHPMADEHPELMGQGGSTGPPDDKGWCQYFPPEEEEDDE